jgi:hypothetical protein
MLVATAQPALAWGELGHRTVGEIAYANVKPEVCADRRAAQGRGGLGDAFVQGGNLSDAAVYPDCLHAYMWRFAYTFPFHYQDIDVDKPFDIKEGCANSICVTQQIARTAASLPTAACPPPRAWRR